MLVACEESQAVCKEFRRLGHIAWSADLQECSGGRAEWHIVGDCLPLLNGECEFTTQDGARHIQGGRWDLIIAHPPCTYLTNGGAVRMYEQKGVINKERFQLAMEGKAFFNACLNAQAEHIAIDNPVPMSVIGLPPYAQIIQPYEFGDPYSKKTCLWLKNLPQLVPTDILTEWQVFINGGGGRNEREHYKGGKFAVSAKDRSKPFPGIARAIAEQWSDYLTK